jgi:hypothetical protein
VAQGGVRAHDPDDVLHALGQGRLPQRRGEDLARRLTHDRRENEGQGQRIEDAQGERRAEQPAGASPGPRVPRTREALADLDVGGIRPAGTGLGAIIILSCI